MCNRYNIDGNPREIAKAFSAHLVREFEFSPDINPRSLAPGILRKADGERELHPMQFALAPPGSKTPFDPKRAFNDARVESAEKWPWNIPFVRHRCIVPLSEFREPCASKT